MNYVKIACFLLITGTFGCNNAPRVEEIPDLKNFVLIKGTEYTRANIGDFEILDHPVTNAEYKYFVDASGYRAPSHWTNGKIPVGKEDYPVIYINRIIFQIGRAHV